METSGEERSGLKAFITCTKNLKIANILIVVVNSILFISPRAPISYMPSNAAGMLIIIAVAIAFIYLAHLVLLIIALCYQKTVLLRVLSFIMIPLSLLFWSFLVW